MADTNTKAGWMNAPAASIWRPASVDFDKKSPTHRAGLRLGR